MLNSNSVVIREYNSLMTVHEASEKLQSFGMEKALSSLLSIVNNYGLNKEVGVRLLHKHNSIQDDEIMLEEVVVDMQGFSLVTHPAIEELSAKMPIGPNSWRLTRSGFVPSEFSVPNLLFSPRVTPLSHPEFFAAFADQLMELGLAHVLGPNLNYAAIVDSYALDSNAVLCEMTDFEQRSNVVRFVDSSNAILKKTIGTKWVVGVVSESNGRRKINAVAQCVCSVFPEGGHQGTHTNIPDPAVAPPAIPAEVRCVCSVAPEGGHLGTHVSL